MNGELRDSKGSACTALSASTSGWPIIHELGSSCLGEIVRIHLLNSGWGYRMLHKPGVFPHELPDPLRSLPLQACLLPDAFPSPLSRIRLREQLRPACLMPTPTQQ